MSIKIMSAVWDTAPFEGFTLLTLLAISDSANDDGVCWPSIPSLIRKTRLSERSVYQAIKTLIEKNWLKKSVEFTRSGSKQTHYTVTAYGAETARIAEPTAIGAETAAIGAKNTAPIAKPPHPLKGGTVRNRKEPSLEVFAIPSWIEPEAWAMYLEVRVHKRAVMTERALSGIVRRLDAFRVLGHNPNEILETSARSTWTDVYEPKEAPYGQRNGANGSANGRPGKNTFLQGAQELEAARAGRGHDYDQAGGDGLFARGGPNQGISPRLLEGTGKGEPRRGT